MTLISLTNSRRVREILAAVYKSPSDLVLQGMKSLQVSYAPQSRRSNFSLSPQLVCKHLSTLSSGFQSQTVAFQFFFFFPQIPAKVINLNIH